MIEKRIAYNGQTEIEFDSLMHTYRVNGTVYPSVTTILQILNKPGLVYWAVNNTLDYLKSNVKIGEPLTLEILDGILGLAKGHHVKTKQEAGNIGYNTHAIIERRIKWNLSLPKTEPFHVMSDTPSQVLHAFNAFLSWEKSNKVVWLHSELPLFSRFGYCGKLDAIGMVNGKKTLIDFKVSKDVYNEYRFQVAAYVQAYNEEFPEPIEQSIIIRLDKETGEPFGTVLNEDENIKNFEAFMGLLTSWKRIEELRLIEEKRREENGRRMEEVPKL